ncbi:MAG: leucyl/phenylalanyl-tRNA--protein transferase, partial [Prevotella sp.]|nr:leucyl/phenylalanyl-tRNA--protein transferase [Prevotella sp.]
MERYVVQLDDELWFPDPRHGLEDGWFAIGGDLSPNRLILAYQHGIFPWYSFRDSDEPLWFCPMSRFVIFPS